MNKKLILISITLLSLCALAIGGVALAHGSGSGSCFLAQGGGPAFFAHGGGPGQVIGFLRQLDLRDDQMQYLENLHGVAAGVKSRRSEHHGELATRVADKLASGESFETADARALIDLHIEQMRTTAYTAADELTGFFNSLDAEQKTMLSKRIDSLAQAHTGGE